MEFVVTLEVEAVILAAVQAPVGMHMTRLMQMHKQTVQPTVLQPFVVRLGHSGRMEIVVKTMVVVLSMETKLVVMH